ncbi:MAG: ABC transporter ATP-binding protein [Planctomycetota bacterium]|jgi:putative ABC transport system ATP-binding protein
MITVSGLNFRYREGRFRLRISDLSIEPGSAVAVIGASGTGKTTFLNLVSGVTVPQSGTIVTNGVEVSSLSDVRRREFRISNVGFVFQEFELLDYLNVIDNILLPYRISPALMLDGAAHDRALELANDVGIADKLDRNVNRLSHGERQRVAICRALVADTALILADEPTGNLDPEATEHVMDLLFAQVRKRSATLVTVTHDHGLIDRFDRVIDFLDFHSLGEG